MRVICDTCRGTQKSISVSVNLDAELEIAVSHWPFSDQFVPFGRAKTLCFQLTPVLTIYDNHQKFNLALLT